MACCIQSERSTEQQGIRANEGFIPSAQSLLVFRRISATSLCGPRLLRQSARVHEAPNLSMLIIDLERLTRMEIARLLSTPVLLVLLQPRGLALRAELKIDNVVPGQLMPTELETFRSAMVHLPRALLSSSECYFVAIVSFGAAPCHKGRRGQERV
ncbi:hypothetical protein BT96DRAFT_1009529 [Gymnopus androsaceus JB14]|uniref:Uncharacterized protein n=1 Tax=Gymnopus androsaceus JB14 TaxID=1447944 RepID=A0A6A4GCE5_9AGAR|nr:hypothetical protein BT96DRAFT_1009529 [Gymnopus androsaceus JB14]